MDTYYGMNRLFNKIFLFLLLLLFFLFFTPKTLATDYPVYEWTQSFGSDVAGNYVNPSKMTADSDGNTYFTGNFQYTIDFDPTEATDERISNNRSWDIFLTRLNADGTYGWTQVWGGTGTDAAVDIAIDSSGNVYLTGTVTGTVDFDPGAGVDNHTGSYITKYDSSGNYQWTHTVAGTPKSLTVDSSGNFYLAGTFKGTVDFDPDAVATDNHSSNNASYYDVFITRFNSDRSYGWTDTFGGTRSDTINKISFVSDALYLTGYYMGAGAGELIDLDPTAGVDNHTTNGDWYDVFLSKLNPDGSFGWARSFGDSFQDEGISVAGDGNGNIYLTGKYTYNPDFDPTEGIDQQINTITNTNTNIFLSKYDANGNYYWTKAFDGGESDQPYDVTADSEGNVYLTGTFQNWVDFDGSEATDKHMTNGSLDLFITKYASDGTYGWTETLGSTINDYGKSIKVLADKSLFFYGTFCYDVDFDFTDNTDILSAPNNAKAFISKISQSTTGWNPAPTVLPTKTADMDFSFAHSFGGGSGENIYGAVDKDGNLFVTGMTYSASVDYNPSEEGENIISLIGWQDTYLSKFDSEGNYLWTKTFGGTGAGVWPHAIAIDSHGYVYIAGAQREAPVDYDPGPGEYIHSLPDGDDEDGFVSKFDNDGNWVWTHTYGDKEWDQMISLAIDDNDNVLIGGKAGFYYPIDYNYEAGTDYYTTVDSYDGVISKTNADGSYAWTKGIGGPGDQDVIRVAADSEGNVYGVGTFESNYIIMDPVGVGITLWGNQRDDTFLAKFDTNGGYLWSIAIGGSGWDPGYTVAVDHNDNVYVGGMADNWYDLPIDFDPSAEEDFQTPQNVDAYVSKYDADGNYQWTKLIGGPGVDYLTDIIFDKDNNMFLLGGFEEQVDFDPTAGEDIHWSNGLQDNFVTKYNADGSYGWTYTYGSILMDNSYREMDWFDTERLNSTLAIDNSNLYVLGVTDLSHDIDPTEGEFLTKSSDGVYFTKFVPSGSSPSEPEPTATPTPTTGPAPAGEPTVTPTPTSSSSSSDTSPSTGSGASVCTDASPGLPPTLYAAIPQGKKAVMLYFTDGGVPTTKYALVYGTKPGVAEYGVENIGSYGTRTFLVDNLKPNTTYYFKVRNDNGCKVGNWSNEISTASEGDFLIPDTVTGNENSKGKKTEPTPTPEPTLTPAPTPILDIGGVQGKGKGLWEKIKEILFPTETEIKNLKVIRIKEDSALVTWKTNQRATTKLDLEGYGVQTSSENLTKNHAVKLTNLRPGANYDFWVESKGNTIAIANGSFKTKISIAKKNKPKKEPKPTKNPKEKEITPTQEITLMPEVTETLEPTLTLEPTITPVPTTKLEVAVTFEPTPAETENIENMTEETQETPTVPVAEVVPAPIENIVTEVTENLPVLGDIAIVIDDAHGVVRESLTATEFTNNLAETVSIVTKITTATGLTLVGGGAILNGIFLTVSTFSYLMSVGFSFWQSLFNAISRGMIFFFSFLSAPFLIFPPKKKGKVVDSKTGGGVYKAFVIFTRKDNFIKTYVTDRKGEFDFPEEGNYLVRVEKKGYSVLEKEIKVNKNEQLRLIIISLNKSPHRLFNCFSKILLNHYQTLSFTLLVLAILIYVYIIDSSLFILGSLFLILIYSLKTLTNLIINKKIAKDEFLSKVPF